MTSLRRIFRFRSCKTWQVSRFNGSSNFIFSTSMEKNSCEPTRHCFHSLSWESCRPPFVRTSCVNIALTASHKTQPCWNCGRAIDSVIEQYFCDCGMIQPPQQDRNLFEVMEVDTVFDLDTKVLADTFRQLQRKLHPDKFAQKSQTEKEHSLEQSAIVNQAYWTLVKPLSRGLYLLELYGHQFEEAEVPIDPKFLMEIMEKNELIAECESINLLKEILISNKSVMEELLKEVSALFKEKNISAAKLALAKLRYYANIEEKVGGALQRLGVQYV